MGSQEENELHEVMTREIHVMREMLANMHMEQKAIMQKDCASLSLITETRTSLLSAMQRLRSLILDKMDFVNEEEFEFSHLKQQIMTLGEKIQSVHQHNRSLRNFTPQPLPMTQAKKAKVKVITLP